MYTYLSRGLIFCIVFSALFPSTLAVTPEECVLGEGTWTTPTLSQGDDPDKKAVQPFCQCNTGFYWNTTLKSCQDDRNLRCVQTGGAWTDNECQCPEGTVKWTEGFGCDMPGPVPSNQEAETRLENVDYKSLKLISILIFLFGVGIIIYSRFIKSKEKRKKDESQ